MPAIAKVNEDLHAVLGVDVGYSDNRMSTGLCLLSWNDKKIEIVARRRTSQLEGQKQAILDIVNEKKLVSVAIDGPLTHDFQLVNYYRSSEALLSRGRLQKRGKPGQTNSPVGQKLHGRATELAQFIAQKLTINNSSHYQPIYAKSVVEAFPNMFLAALIDEHHLPQLHRDASDRYWEKAIKLRLFDRMFSALLPGRELRINLDQITDHEERAAIVCALTALVVAVGKPVGVGDPTGGDIILPPKESWGLGNSGTAWMTEALLENLKNIRANPGNVQFHNQTRIYNGQAELLAEIEEQAKPVKPYDHQDKAGNPGDVIKHVALLAAADALMKNSREVFRFADTFAGYAYNPIRLSGEWQQGIGTFDNLQEQASNQAITFWHSLWSCPYGLPGSTYPGSSTFIRKLCMKHGIKPQLSLWDISPTVISQLKQVYSDQEADIFERSATVAEMANVMPDLLLIDPPDLRLVERLLDFVSKANAVIIWLPILFTGDRETDESQEACLLCEQHGLQRISVTWGGVRSMRGCRVMYKLPSSAVGPMKYAVDEIVRITEWENADCK